MPQRPRYRWLLPLFLVTPLLVAALPSGIENQIRDWFSGSGGVAIQFKERTTPSARAGHCVMYADRTSHTLKTSCNGSLFGSTSSGGTDGTLNVSDGQGGWTSIPGCSVTYPDAGEVPLFSCGAFASLDQNLVNPNGVNYDSLLGNEANTVSGASCASSGADGQFRRLDADNGTGTQRWVECDGLTETNQTASTHFLLVPDSHSLDAGSLSTALGSANQVRCAPFVAPYTVKAATKLAFQVGTADAVNTVYNVCLYDSAKSILLATSSCNGGTNAGVPCTVDSECPSSTCGTSSVAATGVQSKTGLRSTTLVQNKLYYVCYTGTSTSAQTLAVSVSTVPDALLNTFVARHGTAANTAAGRCPLTLGTITTAASRPIIALVSAE